MGWSCHARLHSKNVTLLPTCHNTETTTCLASAWTPQIWHHVSNSPSGHFYPTVTSQNQTGAENCRHTVILFPHHGSSSWLNCGMTGQWDWQCPLVMPPTLTMPQWTSMPSFTSLQATWTSWCIWMPCICPNLGGHYFLTNKQMTSITLPSLPSPPSSTCCWISIWSRIGCAFLQLQANFASLCCPCWNGAQPMQNIITTGNSWHMVSSPNPCWAKLQNQWACNSIGSNANKPRTNLCINGNKVTKTLQTYVWNTPCQLIINDGAALTVMTHAIHNKGQQAGDLGCTILPTCDLFLSFSYIGLVLAPSSWSARVC